MTTFDWHIVRRLLTGFVFLVVALIAFFILLHYLEYVDDFMDRGATMTEIFTVYYPSYIPEIVRLISPLAIFLSCVYLTGKLAQELQLVALQTSGISLYRLLRPYLFVAVLLTGGMFWFNGWIVPQTNQTVLAFDQQYLKDGAEPVDVSKIHRQNQPGAIVTVGYYDRTEHVAHRVSLQRFDAAHRLVERIDARKMVWVDSLAAWRLNFASVYAFAENGVEQRREVRDLDTTLSILPRDFARTERDVESMTLPAAAEYIDALQRSGAGGLGRTLVGFHAKLAYPLANLVLVLIGVPLAAVRRRGGQAVQIGLGLGIAFAYLAFQKIVEPFGYTGELAPALVAWLPHGVFFGVGLLMLLRARK